MLREMILTIIAEHPGIRKREIAGYLGLWQCNAEFLATVNDLFNDNLITYTTVHDPAQMEFYDTWYIKM